MSKMESLYVKEYVPVFWKQSNWFVSQNSNEESEIEEPVAMPPSARLHQGNTAERKSQIERVEFKCLNLCIKMLERVDSVSI